MMLLLRVDADECSNEDPGPLLLLGPKDGINTKS